MRKRINRFLFKFWPWGYRKVHAARVWFYQIQDDYGRRNDAIAEPAAFAKEIKRQPKARKVAILSDSARAESIHFTQIEGPIDVHDFHEFEKVFTENL